MNKHENTRQRVLRIKEKKRNKIKEVRKLQKIRNDKYYMNTENIANVSAYDGNIMVNEKSSDLGKIIFLYLYFFFILFENL